MSDELSNFAQRYAKAWCSQNPESVAAFFGENGSISINNGPPAVGREAIAEEAQAFMTTFPDIVVTMDKLVHDEEGTKFHWTLTGTNTGPGGTGNKVRISGYELWKIDIDGLIRESKGISTLRITRNSYAANAANPMFSVDVLARHWSHVTGHFPKCPHSNTSLRFCRSFTPWR